VGSRRPIEGGWDIQYANLIESKSYHIVAPHMGGTVYKLRSYTSIKIMAVCVDIFSLGVGTKIDRRGTNLHRVLSGVQTANIQVRVPVVPGRITRITAWLAVIQTNTAVGRPTFSIVINSSVGIELLNFGDKLVVGGPVTL
jgi:hypothetical protein